MQKSRIVDGAVIKNSDTTKVKHVFVYMPMSKTPSKMQKSEMIDGAVMNHSDTCLSKTHIQCKNRKLYALIISKSEP